MIVSYEKCFIGFPLNFINKYDHLHFFVENVLEALKKTFKANVNQKKAVFKSMWRYGL